MKIVAINAAKQDKIDVQHLKRSQKKLDAGLIAPARAEDIADDELAPEHAAEPIKSMEDINRISQYLIENKRYRDNMLFIVGINFGLRVSDLRLLKFCCNLSVDDVGNKIYEEIDDVMTEYSSANEVPPYKDVIDDCWEEIKSRQGNGYAGIPFKFKTLNEYATIEPGELFIFAAEAKQGKSIMLLNCAIDLLKRDLAVLYLDSELNTRLFTARVLAHLSGVEYKRLTSGNYTGEEAKKIDAAREWMKTRKFTHIYIPCFDMQSIYTTVKKVKHTQGLCLTTSLSTATSGFRFLRSVRFRRSCVSVKF